jgi:hypothetical protein
LEILDNLQMVAGGNKMPTTGNQSKPANLALVDRAEIVPLEVNSQDSNHVFPHILTERFIVPTAWFVFKPF